MSEHDELRRKRLRKLAKDKDGVLQVDAVDLRWLLDEVSRLQQSNSRLRRQNRRLRLRLDRAGGSPDEGSPDEEGGSDPGGDR